MSLKFPDELTINGTEWTYKPFRFNVNKINAGKSEPSWKDVILSGSGLLTLINAKANGLNYVKLFGKCEQSGTPQPDTPMDIWCNNGVLKLSPNIAKIDDSTIWTAFIAGQYIEINVPAGTYTCSTNIPPTTQIIANAWFDDNTTFSSSTNPVSVTNSKTVTTTGGSLYFGVRSEGGYLAGIKDGTYWVQIEQGSTVTEHIPYGQVYTDGTQETITVDTTEDTATAEMLLNAGDYKDEQNITTGVITRNVGIKVLDGTEGWRGSSIDTCYVITLSTLLATGTVPCYSTHFKGGYTSLPSAPDRLGKVLTYNGSLGIGYDNRQGGTENFKQWLQDQYNAGTPVIVVYPLATPTTESVTSQPLTIQAGTNVITAEGSIDNLPLEVSYKAGVTVTITEVQNAQLSNNVEVTIQ